jgi:glutamate/tyrosine decarboxylase-like PLP-dependent enzyme
MDDLQNRKAPLEMDPNEFRRLGHWIVDHLADFLQSLPQRPVTSGVSPGEVRALLGEKPLPQEGTAAERLLQEAASLLFDHSLFNGHPRFWGYITSSAAPIGALADFLASAVNPNVGAWDLSPVASEIEAQTIRWIAEIIGYPPTCGGLLVSGGNMANFVGFLAARRAKVPWDIRARGLGNGSMQLKVYVSRETHTWINKAADMSGLGIDAIRWIPVNERRQMDLRALEEQILSDRDQGFLPFIVVGNAGTVAVGAIDPLPDLASLCRRYGLWFHVDGAYGAPAAILPEAPPELRGLREADSVALDPHKWLYSPLEAGCALVRDPRHLLEAFAFHPDYYNFDDRGSEKPLNYYELGPQNSRGFRALKVWLSLRMVGRDGYIRMIRDDIALARALYRKIEATPELQAFTQNLSITTFRFAPRDLSPGGPEVEDYLNALNREILNRLQAGGEVYVSNAVLEGTFLIRACVVNFRTRLPDIEALPGIVVREGKAADARMRPPTWGKRSEPDAVDRLSI